jgi:hypothetical protein
LAELASISASDLLAPKGGGVPARAPRVVVVAPPELAADVIAVLAARGLEATAAMQTEVGEAGGAGLAEPGESLIAWALAEPPDLATATRIAAAQRTLSQPLLLQSPPLRRGARGTVDRAAAAAYLRAFGVAIVEDPDSWIEAIALLAYHGAPRGPRLAIIADPGSWLEASALALEGEARPPLLSSALPSIEPTDAVLVDARHAPPASSLSALLVPVCPRGELATSPRWLYGMRNAVAAVTAVGRAVERAALGRGPAPRSASAELEIDRPRLERQLAKIGRFERRLGDHEAKVLLASYGVPITRQAVATTPSAAVNLAKRIDAAVDIKPWGNDLPSERAGCPVEINLETAAQIRRAFSTVLAGRTDDNTSAAPPSGSEPAVIVRESPPAGRELSARIELLPSVGLTVIVEAPGLPPAAAPAPLRLADATALSHHLIATRAGEPEPDRIALANLLRRASHLAVDLEDRISRLEMSRIVVGSRGDRTLVIDAAIELRTP